MTTDNRTNEPSEFLAEHKRLAEANAAFIAAVRTTLPKLIAALEAVEVMIAEHRSIEQHNEQVPIHDIGALIREPSSAEYLAAIEAAIAGAGDE